MTDPAQFVATVDEIDRINASLQGFRLLKGIFRHLEARRQTSNYRFTMLMPSPMQLDGEVMELEAGTEVTVRARQKLLRTIVTV